MPPLSGSDHDMECYDNEMTNFELSKKPKLSDSSLHRVTPDSGIALHYQSSVSSVGSLSPPIEKASSGEEMSKGFQGYDGAPESDEKRSRHMSELGSDVTSLSLKKNSSSDLSVSTFPSNSSPNPSPSFQKGTIPLSHAPPIDHRAQQPLMHAHTSPMPGMSPGLIHSSQAMVHSPAHNTAFPFNPSNQISHPFNHPSPPPPSIFQSSYPMAPAPHTPMFSPGMHSPSPFSHSTRVVPPYGSGPGIYPHSSMPTQQAMYRSYPQNHIGSRNFQNPSATTKNNNHSPLPSSPTVSIVSKHDDVTASNFRSPSHQAETLPPASSLTSDTSIPKLSPAKNVEKNAIANKNTEVRELELTQQNHIDVPSKVEGRSTPSISEESVIMDNTSMLKGDIEEKENEKMGLRSSNKTEGIEQQQHQEKEQQLYSKRYETFLDRSI